ncbi:MAG: TatD family hydrolase [Chloroflexota bacterium]|nr:TatD family hydrolase [Chloroflexota bacterium]
MWFDSHCHIHLCETASPEQIVEAAAATDVQAIVTVGTDVDSSRTSVKLARDPRVFAAVGVHPNSADEWTPDAAAAIEKCLDDERVVAVGESGLDFFRDAVDPDLQRGAFVDHIELAKRFDKALIIHTRDSLDAALDVLEQQGPPDRFVFHCWSGDDAQLSRALEQGAYISFAGNVSFNSAQNLRDAAARVPDERLLVETDSPYLTPVPHRGKRNEPARVAHVGEAVAHARGADVGVVARQTTANARRFFGIE